VNHNCKQPPEGSIFGRLFSTLQNEYRFSFPWAGITACGHGA
jgi:hypothetical protein